MAIDSKWTILVDKYETRHGRHYSLAKCSCGVEKIIQKSSIKNGYSKMCIDCSAKLRVKPPKIKNQMIDGMFVCQKCKKYLAECEFFKNYKNGYRNFLERSCKKCTYKKKRDRTKNHPKPAKSRIINNVRNRVCNSIIRGSKSATSLDLLGCSRSFYIKYLESLFEDWMSWSNYGNGHGKWNIDHIIPVSSFDLSIPEQQKKCFHYLNTRPLCSIANTRKGKRYD